MALRQTTGFVESLLRLIGLDWTVPDFSTLCRRRKTLAVNIAYRGSKGPPHLLIDSTGIKVGGEGEWNARKPAGGPERRVWRKTHLGIAEEPLEVRAVGVTGSHIGAAPMLPELPGQIPSDQEIVRVTELGDPSGASNIGALVPFFMMMFLAGGMIIATPLIVRSISGNFMMVGPPSIPGPGGFAKGMIGTKGSRARARFGSRTHAEIAGAGIRQAGTATVSMVQRVAERVATACQVSSADHLPGVL